MKRTYACVVAVALLAPAAGGAQVPTSCGPVGGAPYAFVVVGETCTNLTPFMSLDVASGLFRVAIADVPVAGGVVDRMTATFKADPFISFGTVTTNLTPGPITYSFLFGTPIVPGLYTNATSTGSVTVTSGQGGSATVAQNGAAEFIRGYGSNGMLLTSLGVDIGTGTCTATRSPTTCDYPPPAGGPAENTFAPTFYDNLEVLLTYTQTDAGSTVAWSGHVELLASTSMVPEPATVGLVATGLAALAGVGAARRRRTD